MGSTNKHPMLIPRHKFLSILCCLLISQMSFSATSSTNKRYYRYYDANGVANLSSSVTPKHIQHGYDVLDQNMLVVQHVKPFNEQTSAKQAQHREQQSKQYMADQQLRNAYTSSQIAITKKQESLKNIEKQMTLQQQQLNNLYQDQVSYKRQELTYLRQNQSVPSQIRDRIKQNDLNINKTKQSVIALQIRYRKTQQEYDYIITRLKSMER